MILAKESQMIPKRERKVESTDVNSERHLEEDYELAEVGKYSAQDKDILNCKIELPRRPYARIRQSMELLHVHAITLISLCEETNLCNKHSSNCWIKLTYGIDN
jgi:hypothetical protein